MPDTTPEYDVLDWLGDLAIDAKIYALEQVPNATWDSFSGLGATKIGDIFYGYSLYSKQEREGRLNRIREGAAKGQLSRADAVFYYHHSKEPIDFDASVLTVTENRITGKYVVQGEHWSVHGNVWVVDGKIDSEKYDFAYDGSFFRNVETMFGRLDAGVTPFGKEDPKGGGFTINYFNEPTLEVVDWPWK